MIIREHIHFYGRVQGVGFRQKASRLARGLFLTGWVQNEGDESVVIEVQGEESKINHLLQILNTDQYIDIQKMDVLKIELALNETGFGVKY